ncbi:MAG: hypothetical protein QXK47_04070 [Candidatus Bathyarchaeia archaeon]
MLRNKVLNLKDPPQSLTDQIVNAIIMAGLGFFGALIGLGSTGLTANWNAAITTALVNAGFQFFMTLAIQRGLVKKEEEGGTKSQTALPEASNYKGE